VRRPARRRVARDLVGLTAIALVIVYAVGLFAIATVAQIPVP